MRIGRNGIGGGRTAVTCLLVGGGRQVVELMEVEKERECVFLRGEGDGGHEGMNG